MYEQQDHIRAAYLSHLRDGETPVTVFLKNHHAMRGVITGFDGRVIVLSENGTEKLISHSVVSTIEPQAVPRQLYVDAPCLEAL